MSRHAVSRGRSTRRALIAAAALFAAGARPAAGDPYRLRGDVYVAAEPPVGLMVLRAEGQEHPWLDAEALIWAGGGELGSEDMTGNPQGAADALVVSVRATDPERRGDVRVGRFMLATGAVRPVHLDGVHATGRAPWGSSLELFGGIPVVPRLGEQDYEWLIGTRASQRWRDRAVVGASIYTRRNEGQMSDGEVGLDGAATPVPSLDLAGRIAADLVYPGVSDGQLSAATRRGAWRYEGYVSHRSPSRILPATSLFSALGDLPSTQGGTAVTWRAAPRLDVIGSAGARVQDGDAGEILSLRGTLRLDDRGAGAVMLEGRREGGHQGGWTGVRATGRVPLAPRWTAATEVEVAVPDEPEGRGAVWPWGLAALTFKPTPTWDAALAVEGRASPEERGQMSAMFRLSRQWGAP